jgi:hypothetical protein
METSGDTSKTKTFLHHIPVNPHLSRFYEQPDITFSAADRPLGGQKTAALQD